MRPYELSQQSNLLAADLLPAVAPRFFRISVARTHGISTILLPTFKSLQPAKHYFRSRHRAHLRLWGFRCHGRWSPAVRSAPRYLLAANPGSGSLTVGHGRLHGSV